MSEVEALNKQAAECELIVEQRDIAIRLYNHPDFKKLIVDGFCLKDCARYAQESQDPALNASQQADALNMAQAAGHLRRYLSVKIQLGNQAEREIESIRQVIDEVQSETGGE